MADFDINKYISNNQDSKEKPQGFDLNDYLAKHKEENPEKALKLEPESEWSPTESAGQGALQGATLGFSDELGGVLGAAQEKILPGGNPDKKSLIDLYKEYKDFQSQRNSQAQNANPKSYMAGNIAGSIAPTALTGGSVAAGAGVGAAAGLGSSEQDLTSGDPGAIKSALKDTGIGALLGAGGAKLGNVISNKLNPKSLEVAGSKAASKAIGMNPTKELTTEFNQESGKVMQGSDIIKGIGKTLMNEKALPMTGGANAILDNTVQAIDRNQQQLIPLLQKAQGPLDQNLSNIVSGTGAVVDKLQNWGETYLQSIPYNSKQPGLVQNLQGVIQNYTQRIAGAEGNLSALNTIKRELQNSAKDLTQNAFNPDSNVSYEADLLKRMSGIVRQHIEDLANAAEPGTGDQIGQINGTLSRLYTALPYVKKLQGKSAVSLGTKDLAVTAMGTLAGGPIGGLAAEGAKVATEMGTGNPLSRLSKIAMAKGLNTAAKVVDTPIGQLVQKSVQPVTQGITTSPWAQKQLHSKPEPTKIAGNLYNSTDESLKSMASKLGKEPGLNHLAASLNEAIDNNDSGAKNRSIFLILQNPQSRKLVSPEGK